MVPAPGTTHQVGDPMYDVHYLFTVAGNVYPEGEERMEISSEYLADLLIGIAKAQTAVIDAMERANPGFRNTHAVPLLQIAANMRAGDPRLIDLPSRVLLRMQGRVALDNDSVRADLERLSKSQPAAASDASAATAPRAATVVRTPAQAAAPTPASAVEPTEAAGGENLDFSAKS
jgi:hypothetical protein